MAVDPEQITCNKLSAVYLTRTSITTLVLLKMYNLKRLYSATEKLPFVAYAVKADVYMSFAQVS